MDCYSAIQKEDLRWSGRALTVITSGLFFTEQGFRFVGQDGFVSGRR